MEYNTSLGGNWLTKVVPDLDTLEGKRVKLMNECVKVESRFKDDEGNAQVENQVKARFEHMKEIVNMRLNWTTVYALVEAFGKDSKDWMGKVLIARVKDATTGQSVYLIPEGFELIRDPETKRWTIKRIEQNNHVEMDSVADMDFSAKEGEINPEDIPF